MRPGLVSRSVVVAAAAVVVVAGITPAPLVDAAPLVDYVAMSDSFTAGSGVEPVVPGGQDCLRSSRNYAQILAAKNGFRLTDVSCGAADTNDFFHPQKAGIKPQLAALDANTDLVTFSIGGNDGNVFATTIGKCVFVGAFGVAPGTPCDDFIAAGVTREIRMQTYRKLVRAMRAVRQKAPNAQVYALNYLRLVPNRAVACPGVPVTRGDVKTAYRIQTELSDAIERAADETGVTFVDVAAGSVGHEACKPRGVRYVEPLVGAAQLVPLHPNALGERQMAKVVGAAIGR